MSKVFRLVIIARVTSEVFDVNRDDNKHYINPVFPIVVVYFGDLTNVR